MKIFIYFSIATGLFFSNSEGLKKSNCTCGRTGQAQKRIVGGQDAHEGEFPMVVSVQQITPDIKLLSCGGTILTEKHVLTAAHCLFVTDSETGDFIPSKIQPIRIIYGTTEFRHYKDLGNFSIEVEDYYVHEDYDRSGNNNDIAVIVVKGKLPFGKKVGPACFPDMENPMIPNVDTDVVSAGWGWTSYDSSRDHTTTYTLQKVQLTRIWDLDECTKLANGQFEFNTQNVNQICTYTPGKSPCRGDSGGPLFFYDKELERYVIVGVVSFGPYALNGQAGCTGLAGFSDVGVFRDWVLHKISNDGEKVCMKQ